MIFGALGAALFWLWIFLVGYFGFKFVKSLRQARRDKERE